MVMAKHASSSFISKYSYDVFLSFRGADTRFGFTGNLYSALSQRGIFTFIDDEALRKGEEITPSLLKAIQESRIAIIIFSKNYASSSFCLDELVQIHECYRKQKMEILAVFYDTDPSYVRHQKGSYEEALEKHQSGRFKNHVEKVLSWRLALCEVTGLSGWHFKIGEEYEYKFIQKITEEVSGKLNRRPLHIANYPVGLKARMQQIQWLLGAEFDNKVIMLGIHGMGGIGKSTLSRAIYNLIAYQFEGSYFLASVREKSIKHGLVHMQETMLSELVKARNIKLHDVNQGIPILKHRLCRKKVLLVLDDVDKMEQLHATAGGLDWFGPGSIIIITTRDKHLLDVHGVEKQYKVDEFNDVEALELFRWNAFKNKEIDPIYKEIIKRAMYYANGLPLALETIGSNLFGKTLDEWESALETYERIPNRDVQEVLKVSYDSLDAYEKEIFLDIACFFRGCILRYVTNMLEGRGFPPKFGMRVLQEKSLIKIDRCDGYEIVIMHDLIQSMGKEIVRQQSTLPQKRNRLWFYKDIIRVLEENKKNDKIEAMMLDMPEDQEMQWNQLVFGKLKSLQMMVISKNPRFSKSLKYLPNSLRVLEWWGYPVGSLPSNFHSKNLVRLDLSYSNFQWDKPLQNSEVLRHLILRGCKYIRQIPEMSGFLKLTELCVCKCINLIKIHDSFGSLQNLQRFCAEGCTKFKIGPKGMKLTSLEYLCLRDCSNLVIFPEILAPMKNLIYVDLGGTAITNLPFSMQNLKGLQILSLERCKMLESNFIQKLPVFFPNLTQLHLQGSNLTTLPKCIEECHSLKILEVVNCNNLEEIKGLPRSTTRFSAANTTVEANSSTLNMLLRRTIDSTTAEIMYLVPGNQIPEWFDHSSNGNSLCFWFRYELPSLTVCGVFGFRKHIKPPFIANFNFFVRINDNNSCVFSFPLYYKRCIPEDDHVIMLNHQNISRDSMNLDFERVLKTNEWIHGNVSFKLAPEEDSSSWGVMKWTGVYVNRAFTTMENVRFTDPYAYSSNNTSDERNQLMLICEEFESESAASDSHKVDMETQKNQFRKTMTLENKLHLKLTRIKKMKKDLGEKLSAIKANISAIEANNSSIKAKISLIKASLSAPQSEWNKDSMRKSYIIGERNTDMNQS